MIRRIIRDYRMLFTEVDWDDPKVDWQTPIAFLCFVMVFVIIVGIAIFQGIENLTCTLV